MAGWQELEWVLGWCSWLSVQGLAGRTARTEVGAAGVSWVFFCLCCLGKMTGFLVGANGVYPGLHHIWAAWWDGPS